MTEDFLIGFKINVPKTGPVLRVGVIAPTGVGADKRMRLGVYSHDANNDEPQNLLFNSGELTLVAGQNEIAIVGETLVAGDYWLMGLFDSNLNVNGSTPGNMEVESAYYTQAGLYPTFPSPVVPAGTYLGARLNFYIVLDGT